MAYISFAELTVPVTSILNLRDNSNIFQWIGNIFPDLGFFGLQVLSISRATATVSSLKDPERQSQEYAHGPEMTRMYLGCDEMH